MARDTVVYENFRGGEWGTLGARRARPGMFSGLNVRVFEDGSIGPRPGVKELVVTGLPAGNPHGLCYRPIGSSELLAIIDDGVYMAAMATTPLFTHVGDLDAVPTRIVRFNESARKIEGFSTFFSVWGQGVYQVGYIFALPVLNGPFANSPTGNDVELYKDRLVGGAQNQQVLYSDAADLDTFDPLSYISLGYDFPAGRIVAHRDGLSLFTFSNAVPGGMAAIWRLTGTLGSTDVLRRAANALPIHEFGDVILDGDDAIYTPHARSAPAIWDGAIPDEDSLRHLEFNAAHDAATEYVGALTLKSRDILVLADDNSPTERNHLLRSNGVWSFGLLTGVDSSAAMSRFESDKFMFLSWDDTPKIVVYDTSIQRPGFAVDNWAQPGDLSTTPLNAYFSLPEWWDHEGREVRVRSVIVNARKWNTGSGTNNNMTLAVTALDRYGPSAALASATQSWSEAGSSATTTGVDFRQVFNFGDQGSGGGFQLAFTALKGVAIRDIAVVLDVAETRAA